MKGMNLFEGETWTGIIIYVIRRINNATQSHLEWIWSNQSMVFWRMYRIGVITFGGWKNKLYHLEWIWRKERREIFREKSVFNFEPYWDLNWFQFLLKPSWPVEVALIIPDRARETDSWWLSSSSRSFISKFVQVYFTSIILASSSRSLSSVFGLWFICIFEYITYLSQNIKTTREVHWLKVKKDGQEKEIVSTNFRCNDV